VVESVSPLIARHVSDGHEGAACCREPARGLQMAADGDGRPGVRLFRVVLHREDIGRLAVTDEGEATWEIHDPMARDRLACIVRRVQCVGIRRSGEVVYDQPKMLQGKALKIEILRQVQLAGFGLELVSDEPHWPEP
jgi:hypothetical protein